MPPQTAPTVCPLLEEPANGVPEVATTPQHFSAAARALASGHGSFAVDTERASSFRYDDRAFVIQIRRRGARTVLLAPEGDRDACARALFPVLSGADWVIHAAPSDLPGLASLGLSPGSLIDTELAGKMLDVAQPNLAAMTRTFLGVDLAKGHGYEDWSRTPLPREWRCYAALDVELLDDLADVLIEQLDAAGKLPWAEEEFDYLVSAGSHIAAPSPRTWNTLKGIHRLRCPENVAVAYRLWHVREDRARDQDLAPHRVLRARALLDIAERLPRSRADLRAIPGYRRDMREHRGADDGLWLSAVAEALSAPRSSWPRFPTTERRGAPKSRDWQRINPGAARLLNRCREAVARRAMELRLPHGVLLEPRVLREAVWDHVVNQPLGSTEDIELRLTSLNVRPWQCSQVIDCLAPLLNENKSR